MKERAERNRTLSLSDQEKSSYIELLLEDNNAIQSNDYLNRIYCGDCLIGIDYLQNKSLNLIFLDPPYNLNKNFGQIKFKETSLSEYALYLELFIQKIIPKMKDDSSIYVCGDWRSSASIQLVLEKYFYIRNRITFQREKGRGALSNWKNAHEDIWFATVSDEYYFDVESVKMKRKVIAPYRENGKPKDWEETEMGNFRTTYPSNFWDDITIPFWSMPENTDHPTQKPEKLLAKIILASSKPGDVVFDPFLGSGTTAVVAQKLDRNYVGMEIEPEYCMLARKRLILAQADNTIQGYTDGCFWERNTLNAIQGIKNSAKINSDKSNSLF